MNLSGNIIGAVIILGVLIYLVYIFAAKGPAEDPCLCHHASSSKEKELAYMITLDELQNAAVVYSMDHDGSLPTLTGNYTNNCCQNCRVININALLEANGGILHEAPDGLYLSASGNDNCGGNAILGCNNYSSYIWIVNTSGNIFSYCAGSGCTTINACYQDVWP